MFTTPTAEAAADRVFAWAQLDDCFRCSNGGVEGDTSSKHDIEGIDGRLGSGEGGGERGGEELDDVV